MSVLVYTSSSDGKFKKSAFELVSYGKKVAEELGTNIIALRSCFVTLLVISNIHLTLKRLLK